MPTSRANLKGVKAGATGVIVPRVAAIKVAVAVVLVGAAAPHLKASSSVVLAQLLGRDDQEAVAMIAVRVAVEVTNAVEHADRSDPLLLPCLCPR
jgi:hypothetical protein